MTSWALTSHKYTEKWTNEWDKIKKSNGIEVDDMYMSTRDDSWGA